MPARASAVLRRLVPALLCASLAGPAGAEETGDWLRWVPDAYDGAIFSGDRSLGGATEFARDGDRLGGRYGFTEPDGAVVEGVLEDCRAEAERVLVCRWRDRYGAGPFAAAFDPGLQEFRGFWWVEGDGRVRHPWWGRRRVGS